MKRVLSVLALCVLATPAFAQPRVCLASLDEKGMVRLRIFTGSPEFQQRITYTEEVEGKKVQKEASVSTKHLSETILTVSAEAFDVYVDDRKLDSKALKDLLPKEAPVLVVREKLSPALLKAIKKGTLILVAPVPLDDYGPVIVAPAS